ncbi:sulfotransferase [Pseudokineococcus lusitanus]|uniref:Sulfotransferase family protein n=1 Tax=Pseudokineococcus lusitanus TaxID=763993 RepID=A0A3N1HNL2_9ACTN|nr:sulfotransferase [Pseudokineococcus lusitanus]ROP44029.1 sulfotransferase family protein [Pseudokineococcus lusitanus]
MAEPVVVLLVAGSGRSGSTLLASATGQLPGAFCAGELRYLWSRGAVEDHRCGCGRAFSACPVWSAVLAEVRRAHPDLDPAALAARLRARLRVRRLPAVLLRRAAGRRPLARHPDDAVLADLYRATARVTGARVVVDPSKLPTYGLLLEGLPDVDLRVVHLVRDPRATAWSWQRRKPTRDVPGEETLMPRPGLLRSTALWALWNAAAAAWWPPRAGRAVRVRYTDLVARPEAALAAVARVADLPDDGVAGGDAPLVRRGADGVPQVHLAPTHTVAGNPDRHGSGAVALREDDEWRTRMPRGPRAVVGALTAPVRLALAGRPGATS